ncbi:hypothetical protein BD769DRAFT_1095297 [Suillus cothurnatus]|nr:hypothetical protein BD769DRAFT_1095297 [Suillus cothurnatus]
MPPNPKFYMDSNDDNVSNDFAPLVYLLRRLSRSSRLPALLPRKEERTWLFKFWFAYKKISGEYDNNMYERCKWQYGNTNALRMGNYIYCFLLPSNMNNQAGLFSAVNTAFIIAMQPNPADTTNDLLVQFMQNSWNGSSLAQPVALSAPVAYSSSKIWMQVLAYTSLTFSLLAAFGAVLGKQC